MSIRNMMIGGAGASPPDAPTSVVATATGSTTMSVAFSAPANNGGSAITSFTVTSSPGGVTASGASSPITVTGLTASTSYTFTVTATNAIGTGVASSASSAVSTEAPGLYSFTTATFTPGGRRGRSGPTAAQMRTGVGSPSWAATYLNTGDVAGIQAWTVPATANYDITAAAASGGVGGSSTSFRGGRGAIFKGRFALSQGEILYMCVGQRGGNIPEATGGGGGGGASFVSLSNRSTGSLMIIAGGGGGGCGNSNAGDGGDGQSASSDGGIGTGSAPAPGSSGAGGGSGSSAAPGGAGWLSNGGSHADTTRTNVPIYAAALSSAGDAKGAGGGLCAASINVLGESNFDDNGVDSASAAADNSNPGRGCDQGGFGGGGAGEWCSAGQCGGGGGYSGGSGSNSSNGSAGGGGSLVTSGTHARLVTNNGFQGYNPSTLAANPGTSSTVGAANKLNYGSTGYIIITKV